MFIANRKNLCFGFTFGQPTLTAHAAMQSQQHKQNTPEPHSKPTLQRTDPMTIPLNRMTLEERERLAYAEGFTESAKLFALADDAEIQADSVILEMQDLRDEVAALENALYVALPFVEDHEGSDIYKPGVVARALRTIREALGETE
jgi:hypothetical protein